MERLFSPYTRYQYMLESQVRLEVFRSRRKESQVRLVVFRSRRKSRGRLEAFKSRSTELLQEQNLDVSTEELLSSERAFTYVDLHAMSGRPKYSLVVDTACICRS
jgi:hypothetical protein